jgi:hypothetical protein
VSGPEDAREQSANPTRSPELTPDISPGIPQNDLPPESRITAFVTGDVLCITVPSSPTKAGCLTGSWAGAAASGFLAVTFITQGMLSHNPFFSISGALCFGISAWQIAARRSELFFKGDPAIFEITLETIRLTRGPPAKLPQTWLRSEVQNVLPDTRDKFGRAPLILHLVNCPPVALFSALQYEESRWMAAQIRRKWNMNQPIDRSGEARTAVQGDTAPAAPSS